MRVDTKPIREATAQCLKFWKAKTKENQKGKQSVTLHMDGDCEGRFFSKVRHAANIA